MSTLDSDLFVAVGSNNLNVVKSLISNKRTSVNIFNTQGLMPLHIAAEQGSVEILKELIDAGANINAETHTKKTPLLIAAEHGRFLIIKHLLEKPNLNVNKFYDGVTPLYVACEKGFKDVVRALLSYHRCMYYINIDHKGSKPLHIAAKNGFDEIITILLEKKPSVNITDSTGCTPLWLALLNYHEECAQAILNDYRTDVNLRFEDQTPLEYAIHAKYEKIAVALIKKGAKIKTTDKDGLTPLHHAIGEGMLSVVACLLNSGASIDAKTKRGNTPLHVAAMDGELEITRLLVDKGAVVDLRSGYYKFTPLQLAVKCEKLDVAKFLIDKGADINALDHNAHYSLDKGGTLLHWAARHYINDKIIRFLVENGADVNATAYDGRTPLCLAVKHNASFETMTYLIEKGATLNNSRGCTPLYWAIYMDFGGHNPDVTDFLINMGSDVNGYIDTFGYDFDSMRTALHLARHLSTVKLLIEKGANVNAVDIEGNTPLHLSRSLPIAKHLVEKGASVNVANNIGDTPLHHAKNFHIAKFLIEKGANVNATNNEGHTPLHLALNTSIAELLLEKGADLMAVTKSGKTVLHTAAEAEVLMIATYKDVPELVDFFLRKGIDVNVRDNEGNTPLHCCEKESNVQVAARLLENGADMTATNNLNQTPIECDKYFNQGGGVFCGMLRSVEKLFTALKNGEGSPNIQSLIAQTRVINFAEGDEKLTILHYAVQGNRPKVIEFLLREKRTTIGLGSVACAKLLVRGKRFSRPKDVVFSTLAKINVNARSKDNLTPLHYAAQKNDFNTVRLLLESGAIYNAKTNESKTPLELSDSNSIRHLFSLVETFLEAVRVGNYEQVIQCMQEERCIVNAVESDGNSSLQLAIKGGHQDIAAYLLKNGAKVTQINNEGSTALHFAAFKCDKTMVDSLLEQVTETNTLEAFVNSRTTNGTTALHIAAKNGSLGIVKCLLMHGAVFNLKNNENMRPLDLCSSEDVARLLELVTKFFKDAENDESEIVASLDSMEDSEFLAITNARDSQGYTLKDILEIYENNSMSKKISEMKLLKEKSLISEGHYSNLPNSIRVEDEFEDEDVDLGFGLFD